MKISILLPYKEDYTPKYSGAVSIHVSNLIKYSKYKKTTTVFGNTEKKNYLSKNFFNIKINSNIFSSNNKKYLEKFIHISQKLTPDIIEIHNRPSYVLSISKNLKSKIILYFHNNPLTLLGSKSKADRLSLLDECDFIFFNSNWTKKQFFIDINEINYVDKFGVCYQSTKKTNVNLEKKKKVNFIRWKIKHCKRLRYIWGGCG